jgi:hypothetical protein
MVTQKTSQNLQDIEQLAKHIGDMTAMLQNLSNRENISKGMVSRMDRLATYVDLPFPCPNLIGAPVVHVLPLQRRYERSHLVPFSRGCSTPMTTHN